MSFQAGCSKELAKLSGSPSTNAEPEAVGLYFYVTLPPILLGTSSFTASGWAGSFYPKGMRPADYLSFYAEHFPTVEVDSTFYACPSVQTVRNCVARTPEGFTFAVKISQLCGVSTYVS